MARYVVTVYREPVGTALTRWGARRIAENYSPRSAVRIARVKRGRLALI